jgi:beta-glucosidase/6-phospho-beta-glucosidase/beta-galactosidase
LRFLSGFESTHIFGSGTDVLNLTKHTEFVEEDLDLAASCNLDLMRYSAPWHSIERKKGVYEWAWLDKALNRFRELGIEVILDPLHHTSFPDWLSGGFANADFVHRYLRFIKKLAARYPWVRYYTIINEPFVTALFCGREGVWYPHFRTAESFIQMILNMGEAICLVSEYLTETLDEVHFIHVDTCEKHRPVNAASIENARFRNELRFLVADLVLGKINDSHPLYNYLRENGASIEKLKWFTENPSRIDILGLDYYAHSELEWNRNVRVYPNRNPEGFAKIAMEYVERYNLPVMLTETNIRGFISDRITWLKFMVEQCEILEKRLERKNIPFRGFCWYPFIDSTDWCSLVRRADGKIDPQGIYHLCSDLQRNASELSEIFASLACGAISSADIPAYRFESPIDGELAGFSSLMKHWRWRESFAAVNDEKPECYFGEAELNQYFAEKSAIF